MKTLSSLRNVMPTSEDIAWAAGIFEGEGSFTGQRDGGAARALSVTQREPWILHRLCAFFGGAVGGPYLSPDRSDPSSSRRPVFKWYIGGEPAGAFVEQILPFLSPRRADAARRLLGYRADVRARRSRCARGHEKTATNVYVHPNGSRICRTCRLSTQRCRVAVPS